MSFRGRPVPGRGGLLTTPAAPSPIPAAGLLGWWDASTLALADNAAVTVWPDKSGAGRNFTPVATAPVFKPAALNGLGVIRYDGTARILRASNAAVKQFIVVAKYTYGVFIGFAGLIGGTGEPQAFSGWDGQANWYNGGVETAVYHKNGVLTAAPWTGPMTVAAVMSLSYPSWNLGQLQIGQDRTNTDRWWHGDIGEACAYDHVLTNADRQQVEAYLKTKWGTP